MKRTALQMRQSLFPPSNSLRGRIGIVVSGSFLAMVLLTTVAIFLYTYRAETGAWKGRQGEVARSGAERVDSFIAQVKSSLLVLGAFGVDDAARASSAFLELNPAVLELAILDTTGGIQHTIARDEAVLDNKFTILQSQWYQVARSGQAYLGSVQISARGEPYLILALPLSGGDLIAARISMEELWRVVQEISFGQTGMAYVIDADGLIISYPQLDVVYSGTRMAYQPALEQIRQAAGEEWYGRTFNLKGEPVVSASAPVGATGWTLVTEMQQREAFRNSQTALILSGAGMVALTFVIMTIIRTLMNRMVVDPVDQLRRGAGLIGEGDLAYRFANPGNDELSQVMRAFNQMVERLASQRQKLDQRKMEFEALFEIGLTLISQQSLKKVLDSVASSVFTFVADARSAAIYTMENGRPRFYAASQRNGGLDRAGNDAQLEESLERCAQLGEITKLAGVGGAGSHVCIPLIMGQQTVGVLNVHFDRVEEVSDEELTPLMLLGDQAAIAVENARLHENEQREIRERKLVQQSLIELNAELEHRVQVRTRELTELNEALSHEILERKAAMEIVRASLAEKETLLKEIHHRVKNNLQIVTSLLSLQASRLDQPEALAVLRESQNRVRSMALLHEKLYQSDNLAQIDFGGYIQSLTSYLMGVYRSSSSGQVEAHLEVDSVRLNIDTAVPCSLILNELVSNALKHAFPNGRTGDLFIEFKTQPDGGLVLRVADNGVGFPPGEDIFSKPTLGMQLIASLVDQLEGSLQANGAGGAEIVIRLKPAPVYTFN